MSACEISLFDEPTPLDLNDLDGSPLDVFFATGIVNPFGPTLSVVAAAGEPFERKELRANSKHTPFTKSEGTIISFKTGELDVDI